MDEDSALFTAALMHKEELSIEGMQENYLEENREILCPPYIIGFEEDADDSFNITLSKPLSIDDLKTTHTFLEVFPDDDDNHPIENSFQKSTEAGEVVNKIDDGGETTGRIIISY